MPPATPLYSRNPYISTIDIQCSETRFRIFVHSTMPNLTAATSYNDFPVRSAMCCTNCSPVSHWAQASTPQRLHTHSLERLCGSTTGAYGTWPIKSCARSLHVRRYTKLVVRINGRVTQHGCAWVIPVQQRDIIKDDRRSRYWDGVTELKGS